MIPFLIKLEFGLTIDKSRRFGQPCPKCGRTPYRVLENDDDVFCINVLCDFHGTIDHSVMEEKLARLKRDASYVLRMPHLNHYITFYDNDLFPNCKQPIMFIKDYDNGDFIIRDAQINEELYARLEAKGASRGECVDAGSPIIARYYSLEQLVDDGWLSTHDRRIE